MNAVSILTHLPKQKVEDEVDHLKNDYPTLENQPEKFDKQSYILDINGG